MFYMFVGLAIVSVALGHRYDPVTGWLVMGAGIMALAAFDQVLDYLRDRNVYNPGDSE